MTVTVESRQVFTYYIYTIICIGLIHKGTQMLIKQNKKIKLFCKVLHKCSWSIFLRVEIEDLGFCYT